MKNNIIIKAASVLMAANMTFALTSCGSSSSSKADTAPAEVTSEESEAVTENVVEITGTEQTWGIYTVMVPDGWTLRKGDAFNENDTELCSVKKSDFKYFDFKSEKEEVQKQQYEYNKKTYTNDQKDIPATTLGSIEWTGFQYGNDFGGGFELCGQSGGKFLRVSCAGFSFDSPEAMAVLGSLKIS